MGMEVEMEMIKRNEHAMGWNKDVDEIDIRITMDIRVSLK